MNSLFGFFFPPPFLVVPGSSKGVPSPGTLQRSRSDIDVNAAAGAKARHAAGQTAGAGRLSAAGLPPGSYASLGKGSTSAVLLSEVFGISLIKKLQCNTPVFEKQSSLLVALQCGKRANVLFAGGKLSYVFYCAGRMPMQRVCSYSAL